MSGGVDSSVAAALLLERGHEVIGLTMDLFSLSSEACRDEGLQSCCGAKARRDAAGVAAALGIPHYTADFRKDFERAVIADFCGEYRRGRTPNPCVRCNALVKFGCLWKRARRLGADRLATGHHARVEYDPSRKRFLLKKGFDRAKDQSYFLHALTQDQLGRSLFPVGGMTKAEVRRTAARLGLAVAAKPESQEICFIPDRDYARFLRERIPAAFRPGPIVDREGRILGEHRGIIHYTIGQRKGMGVAGPHPYYVLSLNPATNTVVVGRGEELMKRRLRVADVNWIAVENLKDEREAAVKIRYRHPGAKAVLKPVKPGEVIVEFKRPQRAITPGQSAVFYDGETVLGGGLIATALDDARS